MTNMRERSAITPDPRAAQDTVRSLPHSQPQQVFFHLDFRRALEMHRRKAMVILIAALAFALFHTARRWNTYKAESQVYVQPAPRHVIENGPSQNWPYDANTYESYIQQQVHDVLRPDVLAAAVKRLPGWRGPSESEQAAADRLGSDVEVERVGTAYEVSITATASSADQAAAMSNAVANAYIESAKRQERAGDPQRLQLLRDERERIQKELASDRSELDDLNRKLGVASVGGNTPDPVDDQIAQTRAELVHARTDNDQAAAKLTAIAGQKNTAALDAEADTLVNADPGLVSLKTSLNARRSALISQMANLTPNHPLYKQDAEELAKINTSLESMTRDLRAKAAAQIEQKLKNDLERTSTVEARLNAQLAQLTAAAGTAGPCLQRSTELTTDIQRLQARFTVVDEQYRNLTIENEAPGAVYLASAALPPLHAQRGKVLRNGFIVILAGLMLALGTALLAYNLDPRVYIAIDVERVLGFPPMAQVPDLFEVGTGVAEEYMLRVAAAVEHAHQQGLLSSCIFTGVGAGAGTTTISTRVSGLLEAMGRDTVRVDAVGSTPSSAALPAGTDLVHAPRGSRSTALLQQMNEEAGEDTVVVTDTAPLLVSGETEYLARFVDAAIVVVESGITTKTQLREVARTLHRLDVASVGFVLNRISLENADPAFRDSVRAVDAHVRAQTRAMENAQPRPASDPQESSAAAQKPDPQAVREQSAATFNRLWNMISEEETAPQAVTEPAEDDLAQQSLAEAIPEHPAPAQPAASRPEPVRNAAPPSVPPPAPTPEPVQPLPAEQWGLPQYPRASAPQPEPVSKPAPRQPHIEPPQLPAMETAKPAVETAKPQMETAKPALETAKPAIETAQPAMETAKPLIKIAKPAMEAAKSTPPIVGKPLRGRQSSSSPANTDNRPEPRQQERPAPAAPLTPSFAEAYPGPGDQPRVPADFQSPSSDALPAAYSWSDFQPSRSPESFRERIAPAPQPPFEPVPASQPFASIPAAPDPLLQDIQTEEEPYSAASRLGGLRTLMTSLGIRNLQKDSDARKSYPEPESRLERPAEREVFAQPEVPTEPRHLGESIPTPAEVVATPEIIPPRLQIDLAERQQEKEQPHPVKSPRVSRWDSVDDVDTLPSWRGQYRKRR